METTKDALGITDANLDMGLFKKPSVWIYLLALKKYGSDRVEFGHPVFRIIHALTAGDQFMDFFYDRPV
jgi:hypothetical protein